MTLFNRLDALLAAQLSARFTENRLNEAIRYTVLNGGKRFRPLLMYTLHEALHTLPLETIDLPAIAIELIHSYSLIHDDLPAMDNDDWRRGKPSCHRAFDEATAILAGDALQALSFQLLSQENERLTPLQQLRMIETLSRAIGPQGMVYGQSLDISLPHPWAWAQRIEIYQHKTGALIQAAVDLVLIANPQVDVALCREIKQAAKLIGLLFQVNDDLADLQIEADRDQMGDSLRDYQHTLSQQLFSSIKTIEENHGVPCKQLTDLLFA